VKSISPENDCLMPLTQTIALLSLISQVDAPSSISVLFLTNSLRICLSCPRKILPYFQTRNQSYWSLKPYQRAN